MLEGKAKPPSEGICSKRRRRGGGEVLGCGCEALGRSGPGTPQDSCQKNQITGSDINPFPR